MQAAAHNPWKRIWITCGLLYFFSQILFLINIQFPRGHDFDEFHYVPSAKQFLELRENQNYEHPPLGKELMAVSIGIWGDRPIGWRFMSTVFGALTLVGMYFWGLAMFRDEKIALWVALITLANQLLYVQARIGMLDTFMFAFICWALAAFTAAWDFEMDARTQRVLFYFCGAMLGLATASKWFGVIPWAFCAGLVLLVKVFEQWNVAFSDPRETDWYRPGMFQGMKGHHWALAFLVIPLVAYYLTFIPFFFVENGKYGLWDILVVMQAKMWDGQSRVVGGHPYLSFWKDWPQLKRPIWYAFDKEGAKQEYVRGVVLLGNPLIMWSGLVALLTCLWGWLSERRRDAMLISLCWLALYLCWIVIPRKVAFYYYYYPAGMVLSLALGYVFERGEIGPIFDRVKWARWVFFAGALGLFIYFYPILAALRINSEDFRKWMWFTSWI